MNIPFYCGGGGGMGKDCTVFSQKIGYFSVSLYDALYFKLCLIAMAKEKVAFAQITC